MSDQDRSSGPITDFSLLDQEPEEERVWHPVARAGLLVDRRPVVVRIGVRKIAVTKVDGSIYAMNNACPHAGGSLGNGPVAARALVCPVHHWEFDLETGQCANHPIYTARTYPVEVRNGEVFVGVPVEV